MEAYNFYFNNAHLIAKIEMYSSGNVHFWNATATKVLASFKVTDPESLFKAFKTSRLAHEYKPTIEFFRNGLKEVHSKWTTRKPRKN